MSNSYHESTELTWNPTTGSAKVTAVCKFRDANIKSRHLQAMGVEKCADSFKARRYEAALDIPYCLTEG